MESKETTKKKGRSCVLAVPIKDCVHQSLAILLPVGAYPPPRGAENRAARKTVNDTVVAALRTFIDNRYESPFVKTGGLQIGDGWVKTAVLIHIPKTLFAQWKQKPQKYSFAQFVQNVILEK